MKKSELIHLTLSVLLILAIGFTGGYGAGFFEASKRRFPGISTVSEINPGISTVKLMEVRNGRLVGEISGRETRLAYSSEDILTLPVGSEFEIPLSAVRLKDYYQAAALPQNAQFIASRKGKYYYSVFDKRALNLSKTNRIYFKSAEEAEKQGYLPPK